MILPTLVKFQPSILEKKVKTTIDHSRGQKFQGDPPTTMAPKRKHEETELEEAVHPSRQFQVPGSQPKPKKPRKFEPPVYKKQAHASSVNAIKKRIRDVTRRLERSENAPADKKLEDERALAAYQQELASAEAEKIRQKMIKKYHMVRFFGMYSYVFVVEWYLNLNRTSKSYEAIEEATEAAAGGEVNRGSRDTKISDAYCGGGSQLYTILSSQRGLCLSLPTHENRRRRGR